MPEIRMVSTTIGDTGNGSRNSAQLGIQLIKPSERKRSQKQVEEAIRTALKPIPGIDVIARQPADLRRAARAGSRRCSRPRC